MDVPQQHIHNNQGAISQFGNATVNHYYGSSWTKDEKVVSVWMIPYRRNGFFTGREDVLDTLHQQYANQQKTVLSLGQSVSGLGGIGKTQIAVEYAYRYRGDYHYHFWVNASSLDTIIASYVQMARLLRLPESDQPEQEQVARLALFWLSNHDQWLLILDNADEPEIIKHWIPTGSRGHVLITTRSSFISQANSFMVKPLTQLKGVYFLFKRSRPFKGEPPLLFIPRQDFTTAKHIVKEMDGLPLALDQAGAYIEETGCSLQDYLSLFQTHQADLLSRRRSHEEHPASVTTTFSLAFERVEQNHPAAAHLLRLLAFLAPEPIPEDLIHHPRVQENSIFSLLPTETLAFNEAIATLRSYSLIEREADARLLLIHRLVQAVLLDVITTSTNAEPPLPTKKLPFWRRFFSPQHRKNDLHLQLPDWRDLVLRIVDLTFPDVEDYNQWEHCDLWLPHALRCALWIEQEHIKISEAAHLLNNTGFYLYKRARYREAEKLHKQALIIYEEKQGLLSLTMAESLNYLAITCRMQGKFKEAESLFERALNTARKKGGERHVLVATILTNLAGLYREQGMYKKAEPLYLQAVDICRNCRDGDKLLAMALHNLGYLYLEQRKYREAESLFEQAFAIWKTQLKADHPDRVMVVANLAGLYRQQGMYKKAEPLYRQTLLIRKQQLGEKHPDVAHSLNNLAMLYCDLKQYDQAEPLYRDAFEIYTVSLGEEHPHTITCMVNIAHLYYRQKRYTEAELSAHQALDLSIKVLGTEHNTTQTAFSLLHFLQNREKQDSEEAPLEDGKNWKCQQWAYLFTSISRHEKQHTSEQFHELICFSGKRTTLSYCRRLGPNTF